jgi:tetratricopeptide (TPR) repeat protein
MVPVFKKRYQLLLIVIFVTAAYYPSLFAPFNSVDDQKMVNDLLNLDSFSFSSLFLPHGSGQYYRPLLYLTFIIDKGLWGFSSSLMHLENILLHLSCALLVYCLCNELQRLRNMQAQFLSLVTALLFGLHPLATEPVNWVSGRTDLLAGLFVLAALLLFISSMESGSIRLCGTGALLVFAGCLSKETVLFVLPVLLVWCIAPPRDIPSSVSARTRCGIFFICALSGLSYLVLRTYALSGGDKIVTTVSTGITPTGGGRVGDMARVMLKTSGFYLKKLVVPVPLNFGIIDISPHYIWLGVLVVVAVCWCVYRRTTASYLLVLSFCLVFPALPLPLIRMTWTPLAERYAYIAAAPFLISIALLYMRHMAPRISTLATVLVVSSVLAGATVVTTQRNLIWQDNITLFEDTLRKSPSFSAARNELAIALRDSGRIEESNALLLSNASDDLRPSTLNKVKVYIDKGEFEVALKLLRERVARGIAEDRDSLELRNIINDKLLLKTPMDARKLEIHREMLATTQKLSRLTGDPFYDYRVGLIQLRLGEVGAAKNSFEKAWQSSPPSSHYHAAARKLADRCLSEQSGQKH